MRKDNNRGESARPANDLRAATDAFFASACSEWLKFGFSIEVFLEENQAIGREKRICGRIVAVASEHWYGLDDASATLPPVPEQTGRFETILAVSVPCKREYIFAHWNKQSCPHT
jgi:hypothetical protein